MIEQLLNYITNLARYVITDIIADYNLLSLHKNWGNFFQYFIQHKDKKFNHLFMFKEKEMKSTLKEI